MDVCGGRGEVLEGSPTEGPVGEASRGWVPETEAMGELDGDFAGGGGGLVAK